MFKKYYFNGEETNYSVSDEGQVRNDKTGNLLKGTYRSCEYHKVQLIINGKPKTFMAHRLVAETFLPNPDNLPVVHHKDNNPINNHVSNLQWVTIEENNATENRLLRTKKEYAVPDLSNAEWKDIPSIKGYQACKEGFIRNAQSQKVMTGSDRNGYRRVTIHGKRYSVHILVYQTFIGEIPKGFVIDHINGIRDDNRLENLRCITQSENMNNAYTNGHKGIQKIQQFDLRMNFIKEFPSLKAAAEEMGVTYRAIASAAERNGSSCGFIWKKV